MIYILSSVSSFISGMGIGGGAAFMLFSTLFNLLDINNSRTYNLILFVSLGVSIILKNIKNNKVFDKDYFKTIIMIIGGCVVGFLLNKIISEKILKICFYCFMIVISGYEIISCLITMKNEKNNIRKE